MKTNLQAAIAAGEAELKRKDPTLGKLVARQGTIVRQPRPDHFWSLVRAIVSQQISVASAAAIFGRLEAATAIEAARVAALTDEQWAEIGMSRQKRGYLRDLAERFVTNPTVYEHLESLDDEAVTRELTAVKGIGVWTAQMFLMFTLVRLDVFAPDDIGLQKAMKALYGWEAVPPRAEIERAAERWRPWRTIAAWHLWASLENSPW